MRDYKNGKLIYHLTSLSNLDSILDDGLLPRNQLWDFTDVADSEIIECRREYSLDSYVPFHFFPMNPFDVRVQKANKGETFIIIALKRSYARSEGFKILTQHPLSLEEIKLYDYDEGVEQIDWDLMNERDYSNHFCKQVCMAECLIDRSIDPSEFSIIYVKDEKTKKAVDRINADRYDFQVSIWSNMFCSIKS